jgi:predicted enzyme related to lactoylglutathione lyase
MGLGNKMVLGEDSSVILLQLVDEVRPGGGTHIDLKVHDAEEAVQRIIEIGGTLKREPGLYPDAENPVLQWAVMQDPFGNPFCIIRYPV